MRIELIPSILAAMLLLGSAPLALPARAQTPSAASVETAYETIFANPLRRFQLWEQSRDYSV
jgi:hypothetical protein